MDGFSFFLGNLYWFFLSAGLHYFLLGYSRDVLFGYVGCCCCGFGLVKTSIGHRVFWKECVASTTLGAYFIVSVLIRISMFSVCTR